MSSVDRPLTGDVLAFTLAEEIRHLRESLSDAPARSARTLVKEGPQGPVSMTLVGLKPGGEMREHEARGPVTLQVLEGAVVLDTSDKSVELKAGMVAALGPGIRHAVRSADGAIFLLTVTATSHSGAAFGKKA
ncbi:MAG TPA: cupin domain-containing protein [Gemmatimonadales bacterium]|nr:cupin domain-containing protein [Gemmatimonadales bacterium]